MKTELMSVRFKGARLEHEAMPIYELGEAFIALQQSVHKAWLVETDQPATELLKREIRRELALEIRAHSKGSDLYSLAAVIADPRVTTIVTSAITMLLKGFATYAAKRVIKKIAGAGGKAINVALEDSPNSIVFINSTFNQVTQAHRPINGIGGCEQIEFASPVVNDGMPIVFDADSKAYTTSLADEIAYGPVQEINGIPYRLYPHSKSLTLGGSSKINVEFAPAELFDIVRYDKQPARKYKFTGRFIFRFGDASRRSQSFEAVAIEPVET